MKTHLTAKTAAPTPTTSAHVVSFYHNYATQCEAAARNAPNEKIRSELSKMVQVWREFAADHERMLREGKKITVRRNHALAGWM